MQAFELAGHEGAITALAFNAAGTVLAFALFVCTAMIYACLPFLAEWHTPLTPINYTLLGGASGFTLAAALAAAAQPQQAGMLAGWAIVLLIAAGVVLAWRPHWDVHILPATLALILVGSAYTCWRRASRAIHELESQK